MCAVGVIILVIIFLLIAHHRRQPAVAVSTRSLRGKAAILTGGTDGVGFEIAMEFARRGAKVILASPNQNEEYKALALIARATGNHNIYFKFLDLSSLKSVRKFAAIILEKESRLDILVNNAEVAADENYVTENGIHFTLQMNYYSHYLLTLLLLPLLMKTATKSEPCRVINRISSLFKKASLDAEEFNDINRWSNLNTFSNSQLCLVMFTRELAQRLANCNVVVNCAMSGFTASAMFYDINEYIALAVNTVICTFFCSPGRRAQTAIHAAVDEEAGHISGEVYENCKLTDANGDGDWDLAAKKIWKHSVKLVNLEGLNLNTL